MAFNTNDPSKWLFDFDATPSWKGGETYTFHFTFSLYRPNSTTYYYGLTWNINFYVNGVWHSYTYKNPNKVTVAARTWYTVCEFWKDIAIPGYSTNNRSIATSCTFTSDGSPASGSGEKVATLSPNATTAGQTVFEIIENGDNTFDYKGTVGAAGTNNNVYNAYIYCNMNKNDYPIDHTSPGCIGKWACAADNQYNGGKTFEVNAWGPISFTEDVNIKARSYTVDALGQRPTYTTQAALWFFSKPGMPKLDITNTDNNIVTITATKGDDGSHNRSQSVEIEYKTTGDWQAYTEPITINQNTTVYARARTVGEYPGKNNMFKYSDWSTDNTSVSAYSKPGTPTVQVVDNGNNTFCFEVQAGNNGDNNNISQSVEISYKTNTSQSFTKVLIPCTYGEKRKSGNFNINRDTIVMWQARTRGSYTGGNSSYLYSNTILSNSKVIIYYQKPSIEGSPIIEYNKKLTKKSTITISQSINVFKNTKFESYSVYLYHNNIQCYSQNIKENNVTEKTNKEYKIQHSLNLKDIPNHKFKKGDQIYAKIIYNIQDGAGNNLMQFDESISGTYTIESSGIMRVNVNNNWYEGQVWVNVGGIWKEATDVFVKQENVWKEST